MPYVRANRIDLLDLRFAIAAADCGSLRQAAELLSVRHSVLSRSIRHLEHSLGAVLFERSSSGVCPTPIGRNVLRTARMVLEQVDTLVVASESNGRSECGYLSVGFWTSMSAGNLRATLLECRRRFPQIELGTVERSRSRLTAALRNGMLDVLIGTGEVSSLNKALPLWSERVLVSLPKEHPLAARDGAVAELVGIEVGVVSGVINLESSGVEASDWRLRHEQAYHEARFLAACD